MPRLEDDTDEDYTATARFLNHAADLQSPAFTRSRSSSGGRPFPRVASPPLRGWERHSRTISAIRKRLPASLHGLVDRGEELVLKLTPLQRLLLAAGGVLLFIVAILFLAFSKKIFAALVPLVERWRESKVGWLVLWLLVIVVSFPPMIGYSTCFTMAGFVFGVWKGYLIMATATVVGSTLSFLAGRYFFSGFVERLTAKDKRFEALALTLKHDGLKLLIMIRLCPLPYSLTNGAISAIPTVTPLQFALANLIASPKLLIGIFIGSRLGGLAEGGNKMDFKTKLLSWISILIGISVAVGTGWFMYRQTQARARELEALEQRQQSGAAGRGGRNTNETDLEVGYDPEDFQYEDDPADRAAVANLARNGDGISMHTAAADDYADDRDAESHSGYRDDWGNDADGNADAASLDAVFQAGDGDDDSEPGSPAAYKDNAAKDGRRRS
ncbi:hypothetical protein K461DRAFT_273991 [Myriangium duriaei CBS 260.36]|uniref:Golgi apparatus membrane protein TVP38 n=1 Tax=Myriangium duriaei CBS 260.36 TaxID=1168546 RepID=A0A9P4JDS4_9PEZI|nr:hypothetical protein K461DRAFT_273991 [Myriangium duriaei CBS 260.36]